MSPGHAGSPGADVRGRRRSDAERRVIRSDPAAGHPETDEWDAARREPLPVQHPGTQTSPARSYFEIITDILPSYPAAINVVNTATKQTWNAYELQCLTFCSFLNN